MENDLTIGVDIGGSHITAGLVDMITGSVENYPIIRKHVDPHASAQQIIAIWTGAIKESATLSNDIVNRVGFAMPGPFDYDNGVCLIKGFDKYEALYGLNIKAQLAEKLGYDNFNIKFRNDAEAFLEGEMFAGAAKGFHRVIGITLGTGLGSAKNINGITTEANLNVAPLHGNIAEEYISTRWFIKRYAELTGEYLVNTKALADVFDSDKYAPVIFKEFGQNIATVLKPLIEKENPEIVVLGGNISQAWDLFMPHVLNSLGRLAIRVTLVKSTLNENAALIGGACCFLPVRQEKTKIYVEK